MRLKTEDKTYGIQKPTQHFVRGIITLFTSLCLTHPLSLNETFHIHWFVLSRKHVLFFTCSSPLFDPLFKRSIHGLLYLYPFSFFSHSVIRPNLSPVRNIVFLWISTHALRSALRRIRAHPQAPPLGIRRKPLSFATLSIFFFELQLQRNQKRRSTSAPPRLSAILPISAPPPPPLADILNSRLFEEILFGKFSLFHLHSEYHNVILLPLERRRGENFQLDLEGERVN